MIGKIMRDGSYNANSLLTPYRISDIVEKVLSERGVNPMSVWRRESDEPADSQEVELAKIKQLLANTQAENARLNTQVQQNIAFMQNVIMELIHRPTAATPAIAAKPTLSSYLDKKDNKPLNGPDPAKLPA